jgi:arabinogalactan oligomer/maltooligosaccharide transport system permease protein
MVVALGALQSIPQELYEAAEVDGASSWRQFRRITAPLLRPVMVPAITLGIVWTFNNVNVIWLVSNGGEPNDQTHILVSFVYEAAFSAYRFGWAAALSMVIFVILLTFTQVFLKKTHAMDAAYQA